MVQRSRCRFHLGSFLGDFVKCALNYFPVQTEACPCSKFEEDEAE